MPEEEKPEIVWLASYPNSGTSYTMTLVERASNLSTASHYGPEVTPTATPDIAAASPSLPVHSQSQNREGPFWEGLEGAAMMGHTPRHLPEHYVLTKTHCGGRCLKCEPSEFVAMPTEAFLEGCLRTTGYYLETDLNSTTGVDDSASSGRRIQLREGRIDPRRVSKLVHLFRNPFDNVVARFHLDNRHQKLKSRGYDNNATGFALWCDTLDQPTLSLLSDSGNITLPPRIRSLLLDVKCGSEFYKYAQWHSRLIDAVPMLGKPTSGNSSNIPVLYLFYEDYQDDWNWTVTSLMEFVRQPITSRLRPFRRLPDYSDHFSEEQRGLVRELIREVASPEAWELIERRYFRSAGRR